MSRHEKQAWLNLGVLGLALASFAMLLPFLGAARAMGAFGVLGILGVTPFLLINRKEKSLIIADERDQSIQSKAWALAYSAFWAVFVLGSMSAWALFRGQGCISVEVLPIFPLVGWMVLISVQSIATLFQYRQGK